MKAHIEQDFQALQVSVWLYDSSELAGHRQWLFRGDKWLTEEIPPGGVKPDPSLVLPEDALRAIVEAGTGFVPPDRGQARHLEDALRVRNRLLDTFLPQHSSQIGGA